MTPICAWCGLPFTKNHGNEKYCDNCKAEAHKWNVNKNVQNHYKKYGRSGNSKLGTGYYLNGHRNPDPEVEAELIRKEHKSLKTKITINTYSKDNKVFIEQYTPQESAWDKYKQSHPHNEVTCPECESNDIYYDDIRAETSCKSCGLVLYADYDYVAGYKVTYPYKHGDIEEMEYTPVNIFQSLVQSWREWYTINKDSIYPKL